MVISLLNQKGGVGKTTLAINIAGTLAKQKRRVLVIDADPQGSALDWLGCREEDPIFTVVGMPNATIHKQIRDLRKDFDRIIIDAPGRLEAVMRSIIMASGVVAIPVQPSPYDVWAAKDVLDLIEEATVYNEKLKVVFVVNRKIVNTAIGRDVVAALSEYDVPVLKTAICQRVIFAESVASGRIVEEVDVNSLAAKEIRALTKELMRLDNE